MPQDGVVAHRHAQPRHQALRRPAAGGVAKQSNQLGHTVCPSCMRYRYARQLLDEGLLLALEVSTAPPLHPDAELHDSALRCQILELSGVVAVA